MKRNEFINLNDTKWDHFIMLPLKNNFKICVPEGTQIRIISETSPDKYVGTIDEVLDFYNSKLR